MYYRALTILCVKFAVVSPCNALLLLTCTFLSLNLAQVAHISISDFIFPHQGMCETGKRRNAFCSIITNISAKRLHPQELSVLNEEGN